MKKMKINTQLAVATALAVSLSAPVQADVIGFSIGASYWAPEVSGDFTSEGATTIDVDDDLDLEDPESTSLVLTLEHPIPILPNVRYQNVDLDSDGRNRLNRTITYEGETYNAGETVTSTFDLSHDDIVLYYQLSNDRIDLDLGVDLKRFDGQVSLGGDNNTTVDVDETIPLFYLSARYSLNNSGFYVGADINASFIDLGLSESDARDSTFMLGYDAGGGLGVEGGIKYYSLELDNAGDVDTGLEYDGIYLNGYFNF